MLPAGEATRRCQHVSMQLHNRQRRARAYLAKKIGRCRRVLADFDAKTKTAAVAYMAIGLGIETTAAVIDHLQKMKGDGDTLESAAATLLEQYTEVVDSDIVLLDPREVDERAFWEAEIKTWQQKARLQPELPETVFAVSSATGMLGMQSLATAIEAMTQDKAAFPQVDEEIPASYHKVRSAIRAKRSDPRFAFLSGDQFRETMSRELNLRIDEVQRATEFMHELGEVLYYKTPASDGGGDGGCNADGRSGGSEVDNTDRASAVCKAAEALPASLAPPPPVEDVVFLKVSFLIDAFKFIVRHDHREATTLRNANIGASDKMGEDVFAVLKNNLLSFGRLDIRLLEHLWAAPPPGGLGLSRHGQTAERFTAMIALLERFEIAAVVDTVDGHPSKLMVPEFQPLQLPLEAWSTVCPATQAQAHLWFEFGNNEPPKGLLQRLQIKLCALPISAAQFSKQAVTLSLGNIACLVRIAKGVNPDTAFSYGLQIVARGAVHFKDGSVWHTLRTLEAITTQLLAAWPGLRFDQFAVHQPTPNDAPVFISTDSIRAAVRAGETSVVIVDVVVPLVDLVGPNQILPASSADAVAGDNPQALAPQEGAAPADVCSDNGNTLLVEKWEQGRIKWLVLLYAPASAELARRIFRDLAAKGVPVWMDRYAGPFASVQECTAHGLRNASAVCPLVTAAFKKPGVGKTALLEAIASEIPLVPVTVDRTCKVDGWLALALASAEPASAAPVMLESLSCHPGPADGADDCNIRTYNMALDNFVAGLVKRGAVKLTKVAMLHSGTGNGNGGSSGGGSGSGSGAGGGRRERRLSFSEQVTVPGMSLQALLETELKLPAGVVTAYVTAIVDAHPRFEADDLLGRDSVDELIELGIASAAHRDMILSWMGRRKQECSPADQVFVL